MKIQIDTIQKIIKLESSENLGEFFNVLKQMLPDDLWKEFKLETNTIINNWNTPIIWKTYPDYIHPWNPCTPWITYSSASPNYLTNGLYNIDVKF
jgi:hypothetical protein